MTPLMEYPVFPRFYRHDSFSNYSNLHVALTNANFASVVVQEILFKFKIIKLKKNQEKYNPNFSERVIQAHLFLLLGFKLILTKFFPKVTIYMIMMTIKNIVMNIINSNVHNDSNYNNSNSKNNNVIMIIIIRIMIIIP